MAIRKFPKTKPSKLPAENDGGSGSSTSARSSVGGPAHDDTSEGSTDAAAQRTKATQVLASAMPFNAGKAWEYGKASEQPHSGAVVRPADMRATGSTLTESAASAKVGGGRLDPGANPGNLPLDRSRVDSTGQMLTTNQGVPVSDNQHSLKAGLRGPALLEDFVLREKITHFDHERIPERIVHARGSGAHGYFECYKAMTRVTRASIFAEAGKRTPVFARFSTVIGASRAR